ncbi:hypothetical protein [Streptomyces sp. YIM 132580]|uniref:hypothetical protein n=1 Tax=Streptomyces sp. YIM 132580 TaxID=2691958 RepID=UPI001371560D|nr:hypothetical protein [Streptomyces sp. YIM 132580]MXG30399.1 hypothetical protein [Streptomyces sp. YIM 132580]
MRSRFITFAASCGITLAIAAPAATAFADTTGEPIAVSGDGVAVSRDQLSPEQLAAFTDEPIAEAADVPGGEAGAEGMARAAAKTKYRTAQYKRGSALMWTRDTVYFGYNGKKVTSSKAWQESGRIFPNIAKNNGINRYHNTTATHKWRAKNTIGAGVPTPWGDVKAYSKDYTHYFSGSKSGAWSWKG